jgi:CheY-like chemotaxis protein
VTDPRVQVLIVEDNEEHAGALVAACRSADLCVPLIVEVAPNKEEALEFIEKTEFDLVVCDLSIPLDGALRVPDREHGRAVIDILLNQVGGSPLIICSDREEAVGGLIQRGAQGDPFGLGANSPMLSFFNKEDLPECKRQVKEFVARIGSVAKVSVLGPDGPDLKHGEARAIQIYGHRAEGVSVDLQYLGGHSAEKTLRVAVLDAGGRSAGKVVAKIGTRSRILREASKYRTMAGRLPPDLIVTQVDLVDAGAGRVGAVFYGLADNFDRDLFSCLGTDEAAACAVIAALKEAFADLHSSGVVESKRFETLRREIVGGDALQIAAEDEANIRAIDDMEISISSCMQHGDLHGQNILVDRNGTPILIDYAKTAIASGCLDPVTLELSAVFHPEAQAIRGNWPTEQQIASWWDLEAYLANCPFPEFISHARSWIDSVASSSGEVDVIIQGYALRQLRYSPLIRPLALSLANAARARLVSG